MQPFSLQWPRDQEEFWKQPSEACPHSANENMEAQGTAGVLGSEANWGHWCLSQQRPWGHDISRAAGTKICESPAGPLFTRVKGVLTAEREETHGSDSKLQGSSFEFTATKSPHYCY